MPVALVVGYGSIGKRHAEVLAASGFRVAVVSRRPLDRPDTFATIAEALVSLPPELVVICTETSLHRAGLDELQRAGFSGSVLVEKPLWQPGDAAFQSDRIRVSVGYILRYHPVLIELKRRLAATRLFSGEVRCGSYLPGWRPGTDYRVTESAKLEAGGGALRDLSHEIDYARWIFGEITEVAALGGRFSDLEIETDDTFMVLARTALCPALAIAVNYLDRPTRRGVLANCEVGTFDADLIACTLRLNGDIVFSAPPFDRNAAFAEQHRDAMAGNPSLAASLEDGLAVLRLVAAIETASRDKTWVTV